MKIAVDESVSFGVVIYLRESSREVIAIAEDNSGLNDNDVFRIVKNEYVYN
jgi:hypothetical protein